MMNDISNRTLVILAAIAIFFSLFGTITVLDRLGISTASLITGAAPFQNAYVNVTVASITSIVLNNGGNVSFGNGSAAGGVVLSTASGVTNPNTFLSPGSNADADDFVIENDGNVDVNVTINGSRASLFITTGTGPAYNWSAQNHSTTRDNGCYNTTTGVTAQSGYGLNVSQNPFGVGPNASVCQNLSYRNANDTVNVTIRLYIPADTEPNTYSDTRVFFMAVKVEA